MCQSHTFRWILQHCLVMNYIFVNLSKKVHFSIHEELPVGTFVGSLLDHVTGTHENLNFIKFTKHFEDLSSLFSVDQFTGVIRVAERIDREALCLNTSWNDRKPVEYSPSFATTLNQTTRANCELHFNVNCLSAPKSHVVARPLTGKLVALFDISITVRDVNDNKCIFLPSSHQTIFLHEDSLWDQLRITLNHPYDPDDNALGFSVDPRSIRYVPLKDIRSNMSTLYAIKEAEFRQTFRIQVPNIKTQVQFPYPHIAWFRVDLTFLSALDYETHQNFSFDVVADDGFPMGGHECRLNVVIFVQDCNDNSPVFERQFYVANISENAPIGSLIFQVKANDADSGQNGQVFYRIHGADSETLKLLQLHPSSGVLRLKERPNYRVKPIHKFDILAENPLNLENTTLVKSSKLVKRSVAHAEIHVLDVNDHAPTVTIYSPLGSYNLEIFEESSSGQDIAIMDVIDEDAGLNAQISCAISNQSIANSLRLTQLDIDEDVGRKRFKISLERSLDREVTTHFHLTVMCQDEGTPQLTTDTSAVIRLVDINDNEPIFIKNTYFLQIQEDSNPARMKVGYEILKLVATDIDEGANSEIEYSLDRDKQSGFLGWFNIDSVTGLLSSTGAIDRELCDRVSLTVWATDKGDPPRSASAIVQLSILDYNDNPPSFSQATYKFSVRENAPVGQLIGIASVWDCDTDINAEVHVSIEDIKYPMRFFEKKITSTQSHLYNHNGSLEEDLKIRIVSFPVQSLEKQRENQTLYEVQLYTDSEVDRESYISLKPYSQSNINNASNKDDTYILVILRAEDRGIPKLTDLATVRITLQDENDYAPKFVFPDPSDFNMSKIVVSCEEIKDTVITRVYAFDPDAGENGTVRYYIRNFRSTDYFAIEEVSGTIHLHKSLSSYAIGEYVVDIEARDCGTPSRSSFVRMVIEVDNSPSKSILSESGKGWNVRPGVSDHIFNLYILITVVITSCLISAFLLLFICYLLRRKKTTHNTNRLLNGQSKLMQRNQMNGEMSMQSSPSKYHNSNPPMSTFYSSKFDLNDQNNFFKGHPCHPYLSLYHDDRRVEYMNLTGNIEPRDYQETDHHTDPAVDHQQNMKFMISPFLKDDALDTANLPAFQHFQAIQSPLLQSHTSTSMCLTMPEALYLPDTSSLMHVAKNGLPVGHTMTKNADPIHLPVPWCALVSVESNSMRSTDCDSGNGDSLDVVPYVGLSYITRVSNSHIEESLVANSSN